MPHRTMDLKEAADYLHVSPDELDHLVRKQLVPFERQHGNPVFTRDKLHDWLSRRLLSAGETELGDYHRNATRFRPPPDRHEAFLSQFLMAEGVAPELHATTRASALRELVKIAANTNLVCDDKLLLQLLQDREDLCPTGMPGGIAIPHPRVHADYLFLDDFLVIAYVPGGVPFGSPDGKYSDLFFMPCSQDDRTHLYMLARLARLLQVTNLAEALRECVTPDDVIATFHLIESEFVAALP